VKLIPHSSLPTGSPQSKNADRIVVLDHGKIAEVGQPAQLMEKKGVYSRMQTERGVDLEHFVFTFEIVLH
jgi:ABC-type multidrug transport system ATPase subunit